LEQDSPNTRSGRIDSDMVLDIRHGIFDRPFLDLRTDVFKGFCLLRAPFPSARLNPFHLTGWSACRGDTVPLDHIGFLKYNYTVYPSRNIFFKV